MQKAVLKSNKTRIKGILQGAKTNKSTCLSLRYGMERFKGQMAKVNNKQDTKNSPRDVTYLHTLTGHFNNKYACFHA